jgi:hypothetical protein
MYKYRTSGKKHAAKDTAWKWFSLYVRLRDCIATTGTAEACQCVTCGEVVTYDQLDAGHAVSGRTAGILFDDSICYAQCRKCNQGGDGEKMAFKAFLVKKHGIEWYEMKSNSRHIPALETDEGYRLISGYYREKYNVLKKSIE